MMHCPGQLTGGEIMHFAFTECNPIHKDSLSSSQLSLLYEGHYMVQAYGSTEEFLVVDVADGDMWL
jgi:hypothetical protein